MVSPPTIPRLGLSFFGHAPADVLHLSSLAERLGFTRVSVGDHLMSPIGYQSHHPYRSAVDKHAAESGLGVEISDPFTICSGIGASTTKINVATGVSIAPLYHPLHLLRSTTTIQNICGGRFELGVGIGWLREEFDAIGADFRCRGKALDECLEILTIGLQGGAFDYHGSLYAFSEVAIIARPVPTPIIIGGTAAPALRRAARYGDGYYCPSAINFDAYRRMRDEIDAYRQDFGRSKLDFRYYVRLQRPDPNLVPDYLQEGLVDLTLGSAEVWPDPAAPLAAKVDRLTDLAAEFGLTHQSIKN